MYDVNNWIFEVLTGPSGTWTWSMSGKLGRGVMPVAGAVRIPKQYGLRRAVGVF